MTQGSTIILLKFFHFLEKYEEMKKSSFLISKIVLDNKKNFEIKLLQRTEEGAGNKPRTLKLDFPETETKISCKYYFDHYNCWSSVGCIIILSHDS